MVLLNLQWVQIAGDGYFRDDMENWVEEPGVQGFWGDLQPPPPPKPSAGSPGGNTLQEVKPFFLQAVVVKRKVEAVGGLNRTRSKLKAVEADPECHFLMHGNNVVAALDLCSDAGVSGLILTKSHAVMELLPHRCL